MTVPQGRLACKEDQPPAQVNRGPKTEVGHCLLCMVQSYGMAVTIEGSFGHIRPLSWDTVTQASFWWLQASLTSWIWGRRCRTSPTTPQTHRQTDPHHLISAKNILYAVWFAPKTKQKCYECVSSTESSTIVYQLSPEIWIRVREKKTAKDPWWIQTQLPHRCQWRAITAQAWPYLVSHDEPSRLKPGQDQVKIHSSDPPLPLETRAPLPSSTASRKFCSHWATFTFPKSGKLCFPEHKLMA